MLFETIARYVPTPAPAKAPPGAATAPQANDLPAIDGLNSAVGLDRLAGNRKLYLTLLRRFVEEQGGVPTQLAEQFKTGDLSAAERTAHTIRGVAANLSITGVQASAEALETAIRERADPATLESASQRFANVLHDLLTRLGSALGGEPPSIPPVSSDPSQAQAIVTQVLKQLAEFDTAASESFDAHSSTLSPLFTPGDFKRFKKQLQEYAFAEARALLEQAASAHGMSL